MSNLNSDEGKTKKKKRGKYDDYTTAPDNAVYFLFDVETTGSKRNYDRIIAMSFLCLDCDGVLIAAFSRKVNPGNVRISSYLTRWIHSKCNIVTCMHSISHTHVCHTCRTILRGLEARNAIQGRRR